MNTRHLLPDEQRALERALAITPHPFRLAYALMLYCGLRISEVATIEWQQLWLGNAATTCLTLYPHRTKTRTTRVLPLPLPVRDAVTAHHAWTVMSWTPTPTEPVFTRRQGGKPYVPRTLQRRLRVITATLLHRRVTPHMLRHTFATNMLHVTDIRTVQEALGHTHLSSTQRYTHVNLVDLQNAMNRLHPAPPQPQAP